MRTSLCLALSVLLTASTTAFSQALNGKADIEFKVSATMHGFPGTVTSEPLVLERTGDQAKLEVAVPVEDMTTGNAKRDKEMHHMFRAEEHAFIKGHASIDSLKGVQDGATLPFTLTIAETEKEMMAEVSDWRLGDQALSFTVTFPVSLKDYDLKPPKILFFKVHDTVNVTARFSFGKEIAHQDGLPHERGPELSLPVGAAPERRIS